VKIREAQPSKVKDAQEEKKKLLRKAKVIGVTGEGKRKCFREGGEQS